MRLLLTTFSSLREELLHMQEDLRVSCTAADGHQGVVERVTGSGGERRRNRILLAWCSYPAFTAFLVVWKHSIEFQLD